MSQHGDIDELRLRGKGRDLPLTGLVFGMGGLLLAGLPFGLMDDGRTLVDKAAEAGHAWIPYVMALGSALTGAAVLRAGGRVFLGLGPEPGEEAAARSKPEHEKRRPTPLLLVPTLVLIVGALALQGHLIDDFAARAVDFFRDSGAYAALVLDKQAPEITAVPLHRSGPLLAWASVAVALIVAGFELGRDRIPNVVQVGVDVLTRPLFLALDRVHTGHIGDYAAWMTFGLLLLASAAAW
jgi:multicomponent Na+:H+ antiporter subunit D